VLVGDKVSDKYFYDIVRSIEIDGVFDGLQNDIVFFPLFYGLNPFVGGLLPKVVIICVCLTQESRIKEH
jgi:hypothetical protein